MTTIHSELKRDGSASPCQIHLDYDHSTQNAPSVGEALPWPFGTDEPSDEVIVLRIEDDQTTDNL